MSANPGRARGGEALAVEGFGRVPPPERTTQRGVRPMSSETVPGGQANELPNRAS